MRNLHERAQRTKGNEAGMMPAYTSWMSHMEPFILTGARRHHPAVDEWLASEPQELFALARHWFVQLRACGPDVTDLIHDGCPVACVDGVAFAYVNVYKAHVNVGFFMGASLPDPRQLLQGSGKCMRHVKLKPGEAVNAAALRALIKAAYAQAKAPMRGHGRETQARSAPMKKRASTAANGTAGAATMPVLLAGGNPQIAKGHGDAPVRAYIAAMPGWKHEMGRRLDALIERAVPGVSKAVKWNSPFYGREGQGWFASFHCFTKYIKVTFFRGSSLQPLPPGVSKHKEVRYLDVYEGQLDEAQFLDWIAQASQLPGERL